MIREQDKVFINEELLRNGLASYKKGFESKYDTSLFRAQSMAQEAEMGIWKIDAPKEKVKGKTEKEGHVHSETKKYYINKKAQANRDHELHTSGCRYLPDEKNRVFLGSFSKCQHALVEARKQYQEADGCYYCSRSCHER